MACDDSLSEDDGDVQSVAKLHFKLLFIILVRLYKSGDLFLVCIRWC